MFDVLLSTKARPLIFAIRGDIISTTGYARAARALAEILAESNRVLGVSLHEDPSDRSAIFPGELVSDGELRRIAEINPLLVVHHTTPDHSLPVPNAVNVGLFYWETDAIPRRLAWCEHIASMDTIWAPTQFIADFIRQCGFEGDIPLIPWAHHFDGPDASHIMTEDIAFDFLPRLGSASGSDAELWQEGSLQQQRRSGHDVFVAIQSLAPRKGLPILINEWRRHVQATPGSSSLLLLKLTFRHAHGIGPDARQHLVNLLRRYGVPDNVPIRIGLISRLLNEDEMRHLTKGASAVVTCSYGEGFGGPIMEAINLGTPAIASRHTGLADLLPASHALQYASKRVRVQLRDLADVYPSSASWFVPEPGSLAGALATFSKMPEAQRARVVLEARNHAQEFCAVPVVRRRLHDAIRTIVRRQELA